MTGTMVGAFTLAALVVLSASFGARLGRRLTTPPGATPAKIKRRVWIGLGGFLAIGLATAAWLFWAIAHHHAALGVLVVVALYYAAHFGLLAVRYRRRRRGSSK